VSISSGVLKCVALVKVIVGHRYQNSASYDLYISFLKRLHKWIDLSYIFYSNRKYIKSLKLIKGI
jgi:hypothetical protein